jgi:hypothetical protein
MKDKYKLGFSSGDDDHIICRRILLNTVSKVGAVAVETVVRSAETKFGFPPEMVEATARWFNLIEEMRDGRRYWRKPDVLIQAKNWSYSRRRRRYTVEEPAVA